jgi:hypothetical protein
MKRTIATLSVAALAGSAALLHHKPVSHKPAAGGPMPPTVASRLLSHKVAATQLLTNITCTFFATSDTQVFMHTGQPTPADIAATTNGFWSSRHLWSLQTSTDLVVWTTVASQDCPGLAHGTITVDNDFSPKQFFRMTWQ